MPLRDTGSMRLRALGWTLVLLGACIAALLAHIGIDVAGDYLLSHDTYDFVEHTSRAIALDGAVVLLLGAIVALLGAALDDVRGAGTSLRDLVERVTGPSAWRFVALVVGLSFVALVAMESFDTLLGSGRIDDLADVLGGNVVLGAGIEFAVAVAVACLLQSALRLLGRAHQSIAGVLETFLARAGRARSIRPPERFPQTVAHAGAVGAVLARSGGKRAPPLAFG